MKAVWNGHVIAEANRDDLIYIEGNWYFPPSSLNKKYFAPSDYHTTCHWKGQASYFNLNVNGKINENAAWYYPRLYPDAVEAVKKDFTNYVGFWHGVEVKD